MSLVPVDLWGSPSSCSAASCVTPSAAPTHNPEELSSCPELSDFCSTGATGSFRQGCKAWVQAGDNSRIFQRLCCCSQATTCHRQRGSTHKQHYNHGSNEERLSAGSQRRCGWLHHFLLPTPFPSKTNSIGPIHCVSQSLESYPLVIHSSEFKDAIAYENFTLIEAHAGCTPPPLLPSSSKAAT